MVVTVTGILTPSAAMYLRATIAARLARDGPRVVVVDLRRCAVALDDDDWDGGQRRAYIVGAPVVFVVPAEIEEQCDRYCARAAKRGLSRMCYITLSDALSWAECATGWPSSRPSELP